MRRRVLIAAAAVLAVAIVTYGRAGTYRHSDLFQFWAAPRLLLEGRDPYDAADWARIYAREARPPVATPPPPGRHIYPLWSAIPALPLAALPFEAAATTWVVAQLVAVCASLAALARVFALPRAERALLFGIAAGSQPLWLIAGGGNITGFMLAALVACIALARERPLLAGAALALLAMKPHPFALSAPVAVLAAPPGRRVALAAAAAAALAAMIVPTLAFGSAWLPSWLAAALERQLEPTGSNATVWTIGRVLPGGPALAVVLAASALAALVVWWRLADPPPATLVAGSAAVSIFVAPHGWSYDQVVLLLPVAAILRETSILVRGRTVAVAVAALIAGPLPWLLYLVAVARGGEEWSAVTPLLTFALLAALTLARRGNAASAGSAAAAIAMPGERERGTERAQPSSYGPMARVPIRFAAATLTLVMACTPIGTPGITDAPGTGSQAAFIVANNAGLVALDASCRVLGDVAKLPPQSAAATPSLNAARDRIAFALTQQPSRTTGFGSDIFEVKLDGTGLRPLVEHEAENVFYASPRYDPSGEAIYAHRRAAIVRGGQYVGNTDEIVRIDLASGERRVIVTDGSDPTISPDGKRMVYVRLKDALPDGLAVVSLPGAGDMRPFLRTPDTFIYIQTPRFSPTGADVVFSGSGRVARAVPRGRLAHLGLPAELFIAASDGAKLTSLGPTGDEAIPAWSPKGDRIAYVAAGSFTILSIADRKATVCGQGEQFFFGDPVWVRD